jgi:hypothetical protein
MGFCLCAIQRRDVNVGFLARDRLESSGGPEAVRFASLRLNPRMCDFMRLDLEQRFQNIYWGFTERWAFLQALREYFEVSLPSTADALVPYLDRSVRDTMGEYFPKIDPAFNSAILSQMAKTKLAWARSAVDSATVVIMQASLDAAMNDYILLIAEAEPGIWESAVADEEVSMKAIQCSSYAELLRGKAIASATALGNKSLPNKLRWILDQCYRPNCPLSPPGFQFDTNRLKRFDELRHDIAHARGTCTTVENMDEVLLFLWQTMASIQTVVGNRLGLNKDPSIGLDRPMATTRSLKL